jgi:predicted nucleic acid-binding protein
LRRSVVETIIIPDAVYDELVIRGRGRPGAEAIARSAWIQHQSIGIPGATENFPDILEQGEREAIVLAQERQATLLVDDQRARQEAAKRGIEVVGVLWVLGEAKRRGFVPAVRPIIDELLAMGYWLHSERVIRPFLEEMGEA